MQQLDLFADAPAVEPIKGSILETIAPKPPPMPFIDEVIDHVSACWPNWKPIIGDGVNGLVSCGSCGLKTEEGESDYTMSMPMRILEIDVEKRRFIACGAYDPIAWPGLAEGHNNRRYVMEIGDIWPPVDAINRLEDWINAGGPTGWFPPHPFDNWRDACPRTWWGGELRNAIDFTSLPEYIEGDHSCLFCKSFWNVKHSNGGYCTCSYNEKLFKDKSMKERFPDWKPKKKARRRRKKAAA